MATPDDDFDGDDLDLDAGDDAAPAPDEAPRDPDFRATVANGRVTVIPWMPGLVSTGPLTALLWERERAGVTIADLTRVGGRTARELAVRPLAAGGGRRAEAALARWAATAGYDRLWLPDRVLPLAPRGGAAPAATTCSNCGVGYREGGPEFWSRVRAMGMFPAWCPLCGGDMPQWRLVVAKRR